VRRFGPAVAILAFVLAAPVGVLYLAVPPNETADEGSADGFWVEGVDQKGDLHTPHAWGHVEEFLRD
jgi:hypothetical protein